MKSEEPRHLSAVDPWDPSEDPRIQAAINRLVENTPPEKYEELVTEFERRVDVLVARQRAENASPIYRKARKNRIRAERAGKVRGKEEVKTKDQRGAGGIADSQLKSIQQYAATLTAVSSTPIEP